uniref:LBH domain-containing protein n=1 Tax=Astyanax mexicanus TaxID=7994 RepID=A0A8B9LZP3_ASTMX
QYILKPQKYYILIILRPQDMHEIIETAEDCEALERPVGQRGRLPSIVVDPTQVSEEERGGLPWPLQRHASVSEEDDESFQDCASQNSESEQSEQGNAESSGDERSVQSYFH